MRFCSNLEHVAALLLTGSALVAYASVHADLQEGEYQDQSWKQRLQARKPEVIRRLQSSLHGGLRSRASPTPCNTLLDAEGACCIERLLTKDLLCCPQENIYRPECANPTCCDDGEIYGTGNSGGCCRFPGVVYRPPPPANGLPGCCETGQVAPDGNCCRPGTRIEGNTCVQIYLPLIWTRDVKKASTSAMTKRSEDTTRVLLSADLVAEHLVNNGIFTHEGIKHIDRGHRAHNEGALRRIAGRGIATAIKYAFRPGVVYDEERWNAVSYVPLSDTYEFDVKDVPEIYARIVSRPDFESFHWRGAAFDREVLYRLASGHPGYNETLISHFSA